MDESQKETLFSTLKNVFDSVIEDKRKNSKNLKKLNKFKARINIGFQIEKDYYFWTSLMAENGIFTFSRDKLDDYDLVLKAAPEGIMSFISGENSTLHMLAKKNEFGYRKLRFEKGSDGKRHLGILLKLPKILVLDKIK